MEQVDTVNLIVVAVVMAIAAGIPALLSRLPVPGVVLDIVLGAVVGPQILGLVHPGTTLSFMADFGLGMLFLMAGFEMDPAVLQGRPIRNAVVGWVISAVIALGAATLLFEMGLAGAPILTALALCTTAIGALMPMLRDARLLGPPYGPMVLAGGAIGEAAPVIVLSLVLAGSARAVPQALIMLAFAVGAFAAVVFTARASGGHFATLVERTMGSSGQLPMRLTIVLLILLVVLSDKLGIDLVLGAFVAGAIVRAGLSDRQREAMATRLDGVGSAFLVPIFFIASGVRLDVAALLSDPIALAMVPIYAILMLATRGLPTLLLYRADLNPRQCFGLALHLATQISVVVAITSIAVHRGLMPGGQGAALVGGGILTTILCPAIAQRFLSQEPVRNAPANAS
jgi:Kef-type K+ transport system membrane component KefB